jgi:hypothetical protein
MTQNIIFNFSIIYIKNKEEKRFFLNYGDDENSGHKNYHPGSVLLTLKDSQKSFPSC